jgi:hypothetical protein
MRDVPRCGANSKMRQRPCLAPGQGIGGRCRHHGGLGNGHEPLVLITSKRGGWSSSRWNALVIPERWHALVETACAQFDATQGSIRLALLATGIRRDRARTWPQPIGYRIAQMMLERNRVAFVVLDGQRVTPEALLELMPTRRCSKKSQGRSASDGPLPSESDVASLAEDESARRGRSI